MSANAADMRPLKLYENCFHNIFLETLFFGEDGTHCHK